MATPMRRVAAASAFGTVLEWYDFFLYGTASALVFPALFFPATSSATGTLLSFAVFATGFFARPVGGLVAGHFGDRIGRKRILVLTLMTMGLATFAIGVLPTYATIGVAAPVILVVLRLFQGFAAGGEWGGASLLTLEHASGRRGFWGSFVSAALYVGLILGSGSFVALGAFLTREQVLAWGWRIPFLLSIFMVAVGLYLRSQVEESPEFDTLAADRRRAKAPLLEALRHPRNVLAIFLMRIGQNTSFYIVSVFCLSYAQSALKIPSWVTLTALIVGAAVAAVLCPFWGALADRIGFRRVMAASMITSILVAFPLFLVLDMRSAVLIIVAIVIAIGVANASADAPQAGFFQSLFSARIRYSSIALGRETGTIIGGGLSPLIAAGLLTWVGHWWAVAGWMVLTAIFGLVGAAIARRHSDDVAAEVGTAHGIGSPAVPHT